MPGCRSPPYSVALLPVQGLAGHVGFAVAITSDVECLLDNIPSSGKVTALPNIQQMKSPSDTFKINLLTDFPYETINRMIVDEIGDSTFVFGSKEDQIRDIQGLRNERKKWRLRQQLLEVLRERFILQVFPISIPKIQHFGLRI